MRRFFLTVGVLLCGVGTFAAVVESNPADEINAILQKCWKQRQLPRVTPADDATFFRRLNFDVRGKLPTPDEVRAFLADKNPKKRAALIDRYLDSEEFVLLMAMRYADMFRIKSEFPINLWPNAVQLYHRYWCDFTRRDRSWKTAARELLTSSGSNFRVAPVNFFRANADRSPGGLAAGTALALMNFRTETLDKADAAQFANFFSRVRFKSTMEWKEEIVHTAPESATVKARTPDGDTFTIACPAQDPRAVFADWLTADDNPFFARAYVNRAWYWMFGRGIAEPADDLPLPRGFWGRLFGSERPNDPAVPELLDYLAEQFRRDNYRTKMLYRRILNSDAYQAGTDYADKPVGLAPKLPELRASGNRYFALYPVRRLESELLCDAVGTLTRSRERYSSVIPEPFTFIPPGTPAVAVADGSISTAMLDNFGRPPRDSGKFSERNNSSTESQRLFLMNSGTLYRNLNQLPRRLFRPRMSEKQQLEEVYLAVLSRYPTPQEAKAVFAYRDQLPRRYRWRLWPDVLWALVNSREFSFHH